MEWTFVRRGFLPYVGVALVVALVLFSTHFQFAYFLFGAAGAYYMTRVVIVWSGRFTSAERPSRKAKSRLGISTSMRYVRVAELAEWLIKLMMPSMTSPDASVAVALAPS